MADKMQCEVVEITQADVKKALWDFGGPSGKVVAATPEYLSRTTELLKAVADKSASGSIAAIYGGVSKAIGDSDQSSATKNAVKATSFVLDQTAATIAARAILDVSSPGRASVAAGMLLIQKLGLGLGMVGEDQKTVQCVGALMGLAANVGTTAALGLPSGGVLATLTISSVFASASVAVVQCSPPAAK